MIQLTSVLVPGPIGPLMLAMDQGARIHACEFADREARLLQLLTRRLGSGHRLAPAEAPPTVLQAFARYHAGDLAALDALPLVYSGTDFQKLAWDGLRSLPPGREMTYGGQAARLGRPGAARAIGHANRSNPFAVIIPCHRLTGASGALVGYAGGLDRKAWLLAHERRHAPPPGCP